MNMILMGDIIPKLSAEKVAREFTVFLCNKDSVKIDELISHKIKMVIYANQTLRASHFALSKLLNKMININNMNDIQDQMSSMDDIFKLQEMYDLKSQEKDIEEKLRKLGYIT